MGKIVEEKVKLSGLEICTRVLATIAVVGLVALAINIIRLNILPTKFLIPLSILMIIFAGLVVFFAFFKKKKVFKIIAIVLSVIISAVSGFGFLKLNDTINFFSENLGESENVGIYNIMVNKNSSLDENSDLTGISVYAYRDLTLEKKLIKKEIKSQVGGEVVFTDEVLETVKMAVEDEDKVVAINAGTYEGFLSDNNEYIDQLKVIKTVKIKNEVETEKKVVDITEKPFAIYISGIDTRSGTLPDRSLSDVNILAVINPVENKVLLVSVPRDYYVQLAGTEEGELKDKLTHAGTVGGVQLSKATLGELLDVEVNYYIRVNFNFVERLVDAVGGIDVYSDVDYAFTSQTTDGRGCVFYPGVNSNIGGVCALAFARERHAYASGDRHRGENQEQVIKAILEKLMGSTTLLSRYSEILNALAGTFETDLGVEDMTKFVKKQLDEMKGWSFENSNLDGTTGPAYTYSYRSQYLSVMFPDETSIETAKAKIQEILGE